MPKVKRPKKGWAVPKRRRVRSPRRTPNRSTGLPRCPSCGNWTMKKDEVRSEMFCSTCGVIA